MYKYCSQIKAGQQFIGPFTGKLFVMTDLYLDGTNHRLAIELKTGKSKIAFRGIGKVYFIQ